jgi:hypothetical protein
MRLDLRPSVVTGTFERRVGTARVSGANVGRDDGISCATAETVPRNNETAANAPENKCFMMNV